MRLILKDSMVIGKRDYTHGYFYRTLAFTFSVKKVCIIPRGNKETAHKRVRQYWKLVSDVSEALIPALRFKGERVVEVRPAFCSNALTWSKDGLVGNLRGLLIKTEKE